MFLVATAVLALGRNMAVLILGRLLQGFSAAVVWTSGFVLLTDIFGQKNFGEAVGYVQTSVSVGTTSAPLLGGLVYARGGYSAVSAMSLGTVVLIIALGLLMIEPKARVGWEEPVPTNAASPSQILPSSDERSALIPTPYVKSNQPAYFLLLRSGRVLAAMGGIFTFAFVIVSFEGMIPLFVKDTFLWDSTCAALTFLAWIIPGFLGPTAGKTSDRLGSQWVAIGRLLFAVPPLICMRFVTDDSPSHKTLLCVLLSLVGASSFPRSPSFPPTHIDQPFTQASVWSGYCHPASPTSAPQPSTSHTPTLSISAPSAPPRGPLGCSCSPTPAAPSSVRQWWGFCAQKPVGAPRLQCWRRRVRRPVFLS